MKMAALGKSRRDFPIDACLGMCALHVVEQVALRVLRATIEVAILAQIFFE